MEITVYLIARLAVILIFSLILSIQDIKKMSVSIHLQCHSIICALICHLIFTGTEIWIYLLSAMIMGAFYFVVKKITGGKLGTADVWFGFFQGLFLTPFFIPVCLGAEAVAALIVMNKRFAKQKFPFIPFMSFGLIVAFVIQQI